MARNPNKIHIFITESQLPDSVIFCLTHNKHYIKQFLKVEWQSYILKI